MDVIRSMFRYTKRVYETADYWKRRTVVSTYPTVTAIELTNVCNFRCTFCPPFTRPSAYMDPTVLRKILETTRFSDTLVQLHFHGESLLHPSLGEMIFSLQGLRPESRFVHQRQYAR